MTTPEPFVSPVTLREDWPAFGRLVVLTAMGSFGTIGNVLIISSIMTEDYLCHPGNCLTVSVAVADLLVSALVIPSSSVVLLASADPPDSLCRVQWFMVVQCFFVSMISYAMSSVENFLRVRTSAVSRTTRRAYHFQPRPGALTPIRMGALMFCVWVFGGVYAMAESSDIGFDYCTRKFHGAIPYQLAIGLIFIVFPAFVAIVFYTMTICLINRLKHTPGFRPISTYSWDCSLCMSNMSSYAMFVFLWSPFIFTAFLSYFTVYSNLQFYSFAWMAQVKSCVNPIVYCMTNRHFRNSFIRLINYCCCKIGQIYPRRGRGEVRQLGDVRVHILPGYNLYTSRYRREHQLNPRRAV